MKWPNLLYITAKQILNHLCKIWQISVLPFVKINLNFAKYHSQIMLHVIYKQNKYVFKITVD